MVEALEIAIEKAGGQTALARKIGKTQGHICKWLERKKVPANMAIPIEQATGVSRHDLRPDIYPKEQVAA